MIDLWTPIKGFEGIYQVSNLGEVRSRPRKITEKNSGKINFLPGRVLKQKNHNGYRSVNLSKGGIFKSYTIHRLVATGFIDNPNNYPIINHIDFNKSNNRVDNLEWCDYKHNALHSMPNHGNKKFSDFDIRKIKHLLKTMPGYQVAYIYSVSPGCISGIKTGRNYSRVI